MRRLFLLLLLALLALSPAASTVQAGSAPGQILVVGAGPSFTKADKLGPGDDLASRHVTFTPNADRLHDVAYVDACVPAGMRPARVVYVRMRLAMFTKVSASRDAVRSLGRSSKCGSGQLLWRATWRGESEQMVDIRRPGGGFWMTLCAAPLGWNEGARVKRADNAGCAKNPVIVNLMGMRIRKDWTKSHAAGERVPLEIQTDVRRVDAELATSTGHVLRRWRAIDPAKLRLVAPRLARGDVLRFRVWAGDDLVDAPLVVRAAQPLAAPAPATALLVMPSLTWLAYNRTDEDRNGWQDSWYAAGLVREHAQVPLMASLVTDQEGNIESSGVWTEPFFAWLAGNAQTPVGAVSVQVITDLELERMSATDLLRYSVLVFPGHTEYYTKTMYDRLLSYRARGGDMMFMQANSFYRRVVVDRRRSQIRGAWDFSSQCRCSRSSRFNDYEIAGVGFTGFEYSTRSSMVMAGATAPAAHLLEGVERQPAEAMGTYAIEFDAPPPADHPSAQRFTPLWHDAVDPARMSGGIMSHGNGTVTFATGNMLFSHMMVDESTPALERLALQRVLTNVYTSLARS